MRHSVKLDLPILVDPLVNTQCAISMVLLIIWERWGSAIIVYVLRGTSPTGSGFRLVRFRSAIIEARVNQELEFCAYLARDNPVRSGHILRFYDSVRTPSELPSIESVVESFSRLVDGEAQLTVVSRGVCTIGQLVSLRNILDPMGSQLGLCFCWGC